jgi:hypothetical protein
MVTPKKVATIGGCANRSNQHCQFSNMFGPPQITAPDDESDSDVESMASIDEEVAVSKLVPSGEAEAHIEVVWVTL